MRTFNLASPSPDPEVGDPDTTLDAPDATPPAGAPTTRRLFWIIGLFVVVVGGGYIALTQFTQLLAPAPQPPVRPVRPIAKAPAPPPPPALSPAPAKREPPAAMPAKSPAPQQAAEPSPVAPARGVAAPAAPAKVAAKAAPATQAEPANVARAAPAETKGGLPPPARPAQAGPLAAAGSFSLQVGAMINESNAQKLKQRLEQLGYSPVIRKGKASLRRHVVTTGDFADRAGADQAVTRLAGQGITARVTGSGGRFVVDAGSFTNEDDAIDLARQLQRLNFPPRIQDQPQTATVYQVRVGSFPSRMEAQAKGAELKGKGFPYLVVRN